MAARRRPSPLSGEWLRLRWVRRAREIAGGSAAAYGGGDGRTARVTGGGEGWVYIPGRCRAGHIYRAVLGPSPWADLPAQARHGPRAGPARARRLPGRATGRPAGRPEMDMYSHITTWQCKACTSSPCPIGPGEPGPRPGQSSLISTSCGPHH